MVYFFKLKMYILLVISNVYNTVNFFNTYSLSVVINAVNGAKIAITFLSNKQLYTVAQNLN